MCQNEPIILGFFSRSLGLGNCGDLGVNLQGQVFSIFQTNFPVFFIHLLDCVLLAALKLQVIGLILRLHRVIMAVQT